MRPLHGRAPHWGLLPSQPHGTISAASWSRWSAPRHARPPSTAPKSRIRSGTTSSPELPARLCARMPAVPLISFWVYLGRMWMPEQRARKYHRDRVADTLRDEIGTMIQGELSDPRIGSAHVTEVVMNAGGKSARVYIANDGPAE